MHELKEQLRARLTAARRALSAAVRAELSRQVVERVAEWPLFQTSAAVLLYSAIDAELDPAANARTVGGREGRIDTGRGRLELWVIPTDEELLIARDTYRVVSGIETRY